MRFIALLAAASVASAAAVDLDARFSLDSYKWCNYHENDDGNCNKVYGGNPVCCTGDSDAHGIFTYRKEIIAPATNFGRICQTSGQIYCSK